MTPGRSRLVARGSVAAGFEDTRDALEAVLDEQQGAGASLALWHDGVWKVDLWGGYADAARTREWTEDTLVMPYSVTKPFAAMAALVLADRGQIRLDAPVASYWPELEAATTVREVLSHRSGLVRLDGEVPEEVFYDWDLMISLLAPQEPAWPPGTAHGESALFYGHPIGEIVRRVDGRSIGRFLAEEICDPHGLDFHIGLREADLARTADLVGFGSDFWPPAEGSRPPLYLDAVTNPPGALRPEVVNSARWRRAEIPAVNGHGTAKSVAGLYVALQHGGLLSEPVLGELTRTTGPAVDRVLGDEHEWGLGVGVEPDGYGMGGIGGSFGWWSREGEYAVAFMTSHIGDGERGARLENAVREVLDLPPV